MGAAGEASPRHTRSADVLTELRTATAAEHEQVETTLGLMEDHLGRDRLVAVLVRLHAFWTAAEAGLDAGAHRRPADAENGRWSRRGRGHLIAEGLGALRPQPGPPPPARLPGVRD